MVDARLLKTDRNRVFSIIVGVGLQASDFTWKDLDFDEGFQRVYRGSNLIHVPSNLFYAFGYSFDQFSPGSHSRVEQISLNDRYANKTAIRFHSVSRWAERVKGEVEAPDLWSEMLKTHSLSVSTALIQVEAHFSEADTRYIAGEFKRLENDIRNLHQLSASQTQAIHDGLEEMKAAMNRFGKKDWVSMASGLLFNIMVGSALAPSAARDLYNMFVRAIAPLFDVAHKLIQ